MCTVLVEANGGRTTVSRTFSDFFETRISLLDKTALIGFMTWLYFFLSLERSYTTLGGFLHMHIHRALISTNGSWDLDTHRGEVTITTYPHPGTESCVWHLLGGRQQSRAVMIPCGHVSTAKRQECVLRCSVPPGSTTVVASVCGRQCTYVLLPQMQGTLLVLQQCASILLT
jgi:hypothetical protein